LILASRSPRRAELLAAAGIEFTVRATDIDETPRAGEDPMDYVLRLAEEKACAVACHSDETVLAADTTVVLGREILGKPVDRSDAARMLAELSERKHEVMTGVCLRAGNRIIREAAVTAVWFAPLSAAEIEEYVASGEPMDKAGAYGIQGMASRYVERVEGSYTNVVGLPAALVYRLLRKFDVG
jgi:septum formation protein